MKLTHLIILAIVALLIMPVAAALDTHIGSNKNPVPRCYNFDNCGIGNAFMIAYAAGGRNAECEMYINNGEVSGITPPTLDAVLSKTDGHTDATTITAGHIKVNTTSTGTAILYFRTNDQTTPGDYILKMVDPTGVTLEMTLTVLDHIPTPTPTPTPSIGNIVVQSSPAGATIFIDNAIKGITPLTINSIANGDHTVLLRLEGYKDSSSSITVIGNTQTINPTPSQISTTATSTTTTPPTTSVITSPTTGAITTKVTTTVTTATPKPTAKINYSATIAALQSQIAEQNVKITEQGNILDQITSFLRNIFGWK